MSCLFIHDNIGMLYNVTPCAIEELPKFCTCGAPLTYADVVIFFQTPPLESCPGVIEVEELPLKWEPLP